MLAEHQPRNNHNHREQTHLMAKQIKTAVQGGDYEKCFIKENLGKLFVIEPLEVIPQMTTSQGEATNVVQANIWVLLGKDKATGEFLTHEYPEALIFPVAIKNQTRKEVGSVVAGRLTQGENKKGNPPWLLAEANAADLKRVGEFWAQKSVASVSSDDDDDEDYEDDADSF